MMLSASDFVSCLRVLADFTAKALSDEENLNLLRLHVQRLEYLFFDL